ncbi:MAG: SMP-30/gluconolactonase/LRE family protein [Mesorhizobium sp.]|nr:MAG: SMP-30/gluconolactonase/LRE family protein [Mesorhizobium sp.]
MSVSYEIVDRIFDTLISAHTPVKPLFSDCLFAEGPAYFAAGRYLLWSDIPNDRILRLDETDGSISIFRQNCGFPNGNTVDREGRLVTCEHSGRRVSRTEHDGTVQTLVDRYDGKRFNSPNDAVVKSDGTIWFTDPTYGISDDMSGQKAESEIGQCNVYRFDPSTGSLAVVITDMVMPNGLAFSPDERILYVVDSGRTEGDEFPAHLRAFSLRDDNSLAGGDPVADCGKGIYDGLRIDTMGRIWISAGDGVHCYEPGGALLGKILLPEIAGNLCFGGPRRNLLYICATSTLYLARVKVNGDRTV